MLSFPFDFHIFQRGWYTTNQSCWPIFQDWQVNFLNLKPVRAPFGVTTKVALTGIRSPPRAVTGLAQILVGPLRANHILLIGGLEHLDYFSIYMGCLKWPLPIWYWWLVGGLEHEIYVSLCFHSVGKVITPTDELIFFRGVQTNHILVFFHAVPQDWLKKCSSNRMINIQSIQTSHFFCTLEDHGFPALPTSLTVGSALMIFWSGCLESS